MAWQSSEGIPRSSSSPSSGRLNSALKKSATRDAGAELLDRNGVLLAIINEVARRTGGDRDRFARAEPPLLTLHDEVQRARDDLGWDAMHTARRVIAAIEADYAQLVGAERFEAAAWTLDEFLRGLTSRYAE
jgi:hypothetical protein